MQFHLLHECFFMAYRLEANLCFGFHNSLVNTHKRPDAENTLAGYVPIELLRLLTFFFASSR